MRATHGARGDIDGEPRSSQPSELSTEDGDKSGDDDEDSNNFDTEESAAADDDDDDVDETRSPGYMGVMMMRDSWHLKLFFSLDQDVGIGGQSVSVGDFFGNDKIKFLSFKKLNP